MLDLLLNIHAEVVPQGYLRLTADEGAALLSQLGEFSSFAKTFTFSQGFTPLALFSLFSVNLIC